MIEKLSLHRLQLVFDYFYKIFFFYSLLFLGVSGFLKLIETTSSKHFTILTYLFFGFVSISMLCLSFSILRFLFLKRFSRVETNIEATLVSIWIRNYGWVNFNFYMDTIVGFQNADQKKTSEKFLNYLDRMKVVRGLKLEFQIDGIIRFKKFYFIGLRNYHIQMHIKNNKIEMSSKIYLTKSST